jgi:hypothetical protein
MTNAKVFPATPFTWPQARELGISRHRLNEAVHNREVRRILRNVYVRNGVPDSLELRLAGAKLVISPHSVACDRTAAWLFDVDVLDYRELDILPPLETFVLRGHRATRRPECKGGQRDLRACDICVMDGLLVTTPLRTCLDLGCKLSRRSALAAMDGFSRQHGIAPAEMYRSLPRYSGRRGVRQLRSLIPLVDARVESNGEAWTHLEIHDAGLPAPVPQYWVTVGGEPVYRLDFAYPHARVAVEYDGREFHEGDEAERADEERREWLRRRGWTVIVLTKDSFTPEAVRRWTHELRVALGLAN